MKAEQVTATPRRLPLPFVIAIVAATFILGALAGLGLPSVLGSASHDSAGAAPSTVATGGQTMDDARRAAIYGPQPTIAGITGQTMDDARRAAIYGPK